MAESKGVALAILGIVAVIAVVGLIMLFTGATGEVSLPAKVYGGALRGEEFPYLSDRSTGGYPGTGGTPDGVYYPAGFYTEKPSPIALQEDAPFYGQEQVGTKSMNTYNRQPYYVPSGQMCSSEFGPGFRCPQGTYCIPDESEAVARSWEQVVGPCYAPTGMA